MDIICGLIAFVVLFWLTPRFMGAAWRKRNQDRYDDMFGYPPKYGRRKR